MREEQIPLLSLLANGMVLLYALGAAVNITMIVRLLLGFLFVVIGNYLQACKQSYTVGIRLPWTLSSSENWVRTHRLGGYCFIVAGVLMLFNALLGQALISLAAIAGCTLVPIIYSFALYRKGV